MKHHAQPKRSITLPYAFADAMQAANQRAQASGHRQRVKVCRGCVILGSPHFTIEPVDFEPERML